MNIKLKTEKICVTANKQDSLRLSELRNFKKLAMWSGFGEQNMYQEQ